MRFRRRKAQFSCESSISTDAGRQKSVRQGFFSLGFGFATLSTSALGLFFRLCRLDSRAISMKRFDRSGSSAAAARQTLRW